MTAAHHQYTDPAPGQTPDGSEKKSFAQLSTSEQEECAGRLARAMKQLGNPHRLLILSDLNSGPRSVQNLQEHLCRSQPSVSNDLALLRTLGLVNSKPFGNRTLTWLNEPAGDKVRALLHMLRVPETRG